MAPVLEIIGAVVTIIAVLISLFVCYVLFACGVSKMYVGIYALVCLALAGITILGTFVLKREQMTDPDDSSKTKDKPMSKVLAIFTLIVASVYILMSLYVSYLTGFKCGSMKVLMFLGPAIVAELIVYGLQIKDVVKKY